MRAAAVERGRARARAARRPVRLRPAPRALRWLLPPLRAPARRRPNAPPLCPHRPPLRQLLAYAAALAATPASYAVATVRAYGALLSAAAARLTSPAGVGAQGLRALGDLTAFLRGVGSPGAAKAHNMTAAKAVSKVRRGGRECWWAPPRARVRAAAFSLSQLSAATPHCGTCLSATHPPARRARDAPNRPPPLCLPAGRRGLGHGGRQLAAGRRV
jgi:hypothetical protein